MSDLGRVVAQMRAEGLSDEFITKVLAAHEEALARHAEPDPELEQLIDACVWDPPRTGRDLRDWRRLSQALGGSVWDNKRTGRRILLSAGREADGDIWLHGSISRLDRQVPTYQDMVVLHRMMGQRLAYQLFVPPDEHYTIEVSSTHSGDVLHLWAPLTGPRRTPDFRAKVGTI